MDSSSLVMAHTAISLIAIALGFAVLYAMLVAKHLPRTALWFLVTTFLTTLTGFIFFRRDQLLPSHITGIVALASLDEAMRACVPSYRRQHIEANERALRAGFELANTSAAPAWGEEAAA